MDRFSEFEDICKAGNVIKWQIYTLRVLNCNLLVESPAEYHTKQLTNLLDIYQLTQVIEKPTRVTEKSHTLIDLLTCDKDSIVSAGAYPLSISDLRLIYAIRKIGDPRRNPRFVQTRSFKHFVKSKFLSELKAAPWPN